jgi:P pilus assembly chaperone PapD
MPFFVKNNIIKIKTSTPVHVSFYLLSFRGGKKQMEVLASLVLQSTPGTKFRKPTMMSVWDRSHESLLAGIYKPI